MAELIFSISPTQVENEFNFSIAGFSSSGRWPAFTIKNLDMLTFINKNLQFHEQLKYEYLKDEDIDLMEKYLESKNETF